MSKSKAQQAQEADERAQALEHLRQMFPQGSEVSTLVLHVSSSGMQRAIAVLAHDRGTSVRNVSWLVARATGRKLHPNHEGVVCNGCGMDMRFDLVDALSRALYGEGYALTSVGV